MHQKYDIAAFVWPAYTGDELRTRIFWPEGIGEWEIVKNMKPKYPGHLWPRKPLWGYVNEADPSVLPSTGCGFSVSAAIFLCGHHHGGAAHQQ